MSHACHSRQTVVATECCQHGPGVQCPRKAGGVKPYGQRKCSHTVEGHQDCVVCHPPMKSDRARGRREAASIVDEQLAIGAEDPDESIDCRYTWLEDALEIPQQEDTWWESWLLENDPDRLEWRENYEQRRERTRAA